MQADPVNEFLDLTGLSWPNQRGPGLRVPIQRVAMTRVRREPALEFGRLCAAQTGIPTKYPGRRRLLQILGRRQMTFSAHLNPAPRARKYSSQRRRPLAPCRCTVPSDIPSFRAIWGGDMPYSLRNSTTSRQRVGNDRAFFQRIHFCLTGTVVFGAEFTALLDDSRFP